MIFWSSLFFGVSSHSSRLNGIYYIFRVFLSAVISFNQRHLRAIFLIRTQVAEGKNIILDIGVKLGLQIAQYGSVTFFILGGHLHGGGDSAVIKGRNILEIHHPHQVIFFIVKLLQALKIIFPY